MRKKPRESDWIPNPYIDSLTKAITFRLDFDSIQYFEKQGNNTVCLLKK